MDGALLTERFSESLNGAASAKMEVDVGPGNITIDRIVDSGQTLARGELQYSRKQGAPNRSLSLSDGRATFTLKAGDSHPSRFHFPWAACGPACEWHIQLNSALPSDLAAHSDGGNIKLDLVGMSIERLSVDTWGGNVNATLPDSTSDLALTARSKAGNVSIELGSNVRGKATVFAESGAGNVGVRVPRGVAARIHAKSRLGRVVVAQCFRKVDAETYQSPGYEATADRVDIIVQSGAGNVHVSTI